MIVSFHVIEGCAAMPGRRLLGLERVGGLSCGDVDGVHGTWHARPTTAECRCVEQGCGIADSINGRIRHVAGSAAATIR
jgi:hypothetical protein